MDDDETGHYSSIQRYRTPDHQRKLKTAIYRYGLLLNKAKTNVMLIGRYPTNVLRILKTAVLKTINEFMYLGSLLTNKGRYNKEIRKTMSMGRS